jgi:hypothetical protein
MGPVRMGPFRMGAFLAAVLKPDWVSWKYIALKACQIIMTGPQPHYYLNIAMTYEVEASCCMLGRKNRLCLLVKLQYVVLGRNNRR